MKEEYIYILNHSYCFALPGQSSIHSVYTTHEAARAAGIRLVIKEQEYTQEEAEEELDKTNDYYTVEEYRIIC